MNSNLEAAAIALTFLFIWWYSMTIFEGFSASLPLLGEFSFSENSKYFIVAGLFLTFILFLKMRKERSREDAVQQQEA